MLKTGNTAPAFTLPDQDGNKVGLNDFHGKWVILYAYPKDNTSGCTNEALDFTSLLKDLAKLDAVVLGLSPDSVESHRTFIDKHKLGVTLLADPEKKVIRKYGAWGLKKNYGREFEGLIRSTFLIDPRGRLAESWSNVKVRIKRKSGVVSTRRPGPGEDQGTLELRPAVAKRGFTHHRLRSRPPPQ